jgi:hypothetical protein
MVYPGTRAFEWAVRNDYLSAESYDDWLTPEGLHRSVVSLPHLTDEDLSAWCDRARRSFYLRPRYLLSKAWQAVTRPGEARRILRAAAVLARYLFRPCPDEDTKRSAQASQKP